MKIRCEWAERGKGLDRVYHDNEWGVPVHDDRKLFEFIVLDTFQAGLSWSLILHKRENFRSAFDDFIAHKIADYDDDRVNALLNDEGIVRNKQKILATISNAQALLRVVDDIGSFDQYIWQFTGGRTKVNQWKTMAEIPTTTAESDAMSKDLKKRGFKFVGSTTCYAFMQAAGMVNDHETRCFRYHETLQLQG